MGNEAILAVIEAAGDARISEIEQETERKISQIQAEAEATANERRRQARQRAGAGCENELAMRRQQAQLRAGKMYQSARAGLITEALERCQDELGKLRDSPRYREIYGRLLQEALMLLKKEDGQIFLRADPRDQALLEDLVTEGGTQVLGVEYVLSSNGGVIASNQGDYVVVDNTLETRLERAYSGLQREMARQLELPDELNFTDLEAPEPV